jgi:hypothetical protein
MPLPTSLLPPCIPTRAVKPPAGPDWVHELKQDGYRLQVRRHGDTVRLFTRRGYDWSGRYPAIAVIAAKLRARSFTLGGEKGENRRRTHCWWEEPWTFVFASLPSSVAATGSCSALAGAGLAMPPV